MWEPGEFIQVLPGCDWILRPLFNKLHKGVLPPEPDGTVMRLRLHYFPYQFFSLSSLKWSLFGVTAFPHMNIKVITCVSLILTYFICFTIVLFPDSPAPEKGI